MSHNTSTSEDAITESEMIGTTDPIHPSNTETTNSPPKNAFTTLMTPRKHPSPPTASPYKHRPTHTTTSPTFAGRDGLGAYIASPTSYPPSRVLYHNKDFVVIHDLFPKSSIHLLLLPRNPSKTLLHPIDALSTDPTFLSSVRTEVEKLRALAASELRRLYGKGSAQEATRQAALQSNCNSDSSPKAQGTETELPPGRDWSRSILSGIHAAPSMNHLHIHVLSIDRINECMKHRKHYNSFATPFLIPVEDFPLDEKDERRRNAKKAEYLDEALVCWRCRKNFGRRFTELKGHLEGEFEEWKRE